MTPEAQAAMAREFFRSDHPNFAEIEFDSNRVPGALTTQTVVTDGIEAQRPVFKAAKADLADIKRGDAVMVFESSSPCGVEFIAAEFEVSGQTFKTIVLAKP